MTGRVYALDLETRDPRLLELGPGWSYGQGYPVGYALAWEENGEVRSRYLGVRHEAGGNLPHDEVRKVLGPILGNPDNTIVMANCLYDYGWTITAEGYDWKAKIDDVQIIAPLIDDQRRSYSLDNLAKDYLGKGKDEWQLRRAAREWGLKDPKGQLWKLPADLVSEYARTDAERTLQLYQKLLPFIADLGLEKVHQLERTLVPVLYAMRKKGVRVDVDRAEQERENIIQVEEEFQSEAKREFGCNIDPWAGQTIVELFKKEGVESFPLTEIKKEPSITKEFLTAMGTKDHRAGKLANLVFNLRKYQKARSTFIENMILGHEQRGRIFCELHALRSDDGGTVSGRFSCSKPNLQQVQKKDKEIGPMIRSLFLPEKGELWASIDYASQEPRLAAHFGFKASIRGSKEMVQAWKKNPREDPYGYVAKLCGVSRNEAKVIRLGILYGMGGGTLCVSLGLPVEHGKWNGRNVLYAGAEGKALLEKFHDTFPMDKQLANLAQNQAKSKGFVRTVLGRRATFPKREDGEVWFTHKALNRVIQGSAADMAKTAMVNIHDKGHTPLMMIHDELVFSVSNQKIAEEIGSQMESAMELEVPFVCDIGVGKNWGDTLE